MQNSEIMIFLTIISILLIPVLVCVVGYFKNKAIIFYNYNDLMLTFAVAAFPFLYYSLFFFAIQSKIVFILFLIIELILLILLGKITYDNNKNLLMMFCVLYTKLILSFLFIFHLLQIMNSKRHSKSREGLFDLFITVIITPILLKLVQNHDNKAIRGIKNAF